MNLPISALALSVTVTTLIAFCGLLRARSGFTLSGDTHGNFLALDTGTGETSWHAGSGARIGTPPITYQLHGRQYVLIGSGGALLAFAFLHREDSW